jgi:hypothetical protein
MSLSDLSDLLLPVAVSRGTPAFDFAINLRKRSLSTKFSQNGGKDLAPNAPGPAERIVK